MERLGIIDLGSNSARLVIVDIFTEGHFVVIDELKASIRLGQDMERDGFLKPQRVAETIRTLKMFKRLCDSHKVDRITAVATAAVRRAKNQRSFLDEIQATCGIKVRVLEEDEETLSLYRGVINTMDIPKGIIFEISGGSTKIIYYNRRNMLHKVILPFGGVTLNDLFTADNDNPKAQTEKIEEFFLEHLQKIEWLKEVDSDVQMIGVGGAFRNIFRINKMVKRYPLDNPHNYHVPIEEFNNTYEMLRVLDIDKKKKIKGISTERADILPAGLAAINAFIKYMNFNSFTICRCSLREGIMFEKAMPITLEKPISDVLGYSLQTLVKFYEMDEKHVEHVVYLAVQLFKQLRVLHKFPRQYLKILKVAATLHDCGNRIKYYKNNKSSAYMIMNANLYGITHREMVFAGLVVAAHKNDDFNANDWTKYKELVGEEDFDAIKKLGVILRIASSLDRTCGGVVKGINCDVLGDSVIMKTDVDGDSTLEICESMKAASEFKRSFKKNLEIL